MNNRQLETRDYQERIKRKSIEYLEKPRNAQTKTLMIESPTGSGKTVMAQQIAKHFAEKGHKVGWIAHRRELLEQAEKTNEAWFDIPDFKTISLFDRHPERFADRTMIVVDECLSGDTELIVRHNGEVRRERLVDVVNGIGQEVLSWMKTGTPGFKPIINRHRMGSKAAFRVTIQCKDKSHNIQISTTGKVMINGLPVPATNLKPGMQVLCLRNDGYDEQSQPWTTNFKTNASVGLTKVEQDYIRVNGWHDSRPASGFGSHIGTITEICPIGNIETFDIGVFATRCFFANGVLVKNCQHDASTSAAILHEAIKPEIILGLSATPYRTDRAKLCFSKVVKDAAIHQLIREGYLAKYQQWMLEHSWKPELVAASYVAEQEKWGKSLMFFLRTDEAEHCAHELNGLGVRAACVKGSQSNKLRHYILDKFRDGGLDVLTNVAILTEGFDENTLKSVFVRPGSKPPTVQMAGRVFRLHDDIPTVNVVQNRETKYPFTRHATPERQFMQENGVWVERSIKNLQRVFTEQRKKLLAAKVEMPKKIEEFNAKKRPSRFERWLQERYDEM